MRRRRDGPLDVVEADGGARERRGAGNLHGGRRGDEGERERQQRFGGGALGVRVEEDAPPTTAAAPIA